MRDDDDTAPAVRDTARDAHHLAPGGPRSSDAVGSSSSSTGVHWASTRAKVASACSPPESVRKLRSARCGIPVRASASADDVARARRSSAQRVAAHLDHLPHGEAEADRRVLRHHRTAARELASRHARRRTRRRARPSRSVGARSPASSRSSVDFPAPFGPAIGEELARLELEVDVREPVVPRSTQPTPRATSRLRPSRRGSAACGGRARGRAARRRAP